jgi:xylan 1,4-beta-xylosidase
MGTMYSSYTAASIAREYLLADKYGVNLVGSLTWAFEFEDQPYFGGQRALASNGIDLPVLNVFRMLSRMGGQRLDARSSAGASLDDIVRNGVRGSVDVSALASLEGHKLSILVWHYHDDDVPGPPAIVSLELSNLPHDGTARVARFLIDDSHSNAFAAWKRLGSPGAPDEGQYEKLTQAGQLAQVEGEPDSLTVADGHAVLAVTLPREAVSLITVEWR